jgi:hypothetical protein
MRSCVITVLGLEVGVIIYERRSDCPKKHRGVLGSVIGTTGREIIINEWLMDSQSHCEVVFLHELLHVIDSITAGPESRMNEVDVHRLTSGLETLMASGILSVEMPAAVDTKPAPCQTHLEK